MGGCVHHGGGSKKKQWVGLCLAKPWGTLTFVDFSAAGGDLFFFAMCRNGPQKMADNGLSQMTLLARGVQEPVRIPPAELPVLVPAVLSVSEVVRVFGTCQITCLVTVSWGEGLAGWSTRDNMFFFNFKTVLWLKGRPRPVQAQMMAKIKSGKFGSMCAGPRMPDLASCRPVFKLFYQ